MSGGLERGLSAAVVFIYSFMDYPWARLVVPCGVMADKSKSVQTAPLPGSSSLPVLCQGSQSVARGASRLCGGGALW